jgi:hypothetical protein
MSEDILSKYGTTPRQWNVEELRAAAEQYPYFVAPDIEAADAESVKEEAELQRVCQRIALSVGARDALERVLGDYGTDFDNFYPDMETPALSTNDTIDTFLDKFGNTSDKETDLLTRMIFTPTAQSDDWFQTEIAAANRAEEEAAAAPVHDATAERIDAFLNSGTDFREEIKAKTEEETAAQAPKPVAKPESKPAAQSESKPTTAADKAAEPTSAPTTAPTAAAADKTAKPVRQEPKEESGAPSLMESLARVMIKNGNYAKALEIITELNLANPKKSIYFADQIRFLKKLIKNQQKLNNK